MNEQNSNPPETDEEEKPNVTPPITHTNASTRVAYVHDDNTYYRNDGNKHIKSIGFRC